MKNVAGRLFHGLIFSLGLVPLTWSTRIANALGEVWYLLDRRHREVALSNLARAYADEKNIFELRAMARRSFKGMARIPFEIGWSLRLNKEEILRHCTINGLIYLRQAHAKGKGVLVLTLHIGNWELLPISFISNGFNVTMVYRPLDFPPADRFFFSYRRRFGGNPIPKKKSMRQILKALKRQHCVGILLDQDSGLTAGVFADFYGHPACTNKGLALLALKTEAPVIPAFLVRRGMRFEIHIGPEIPLIRTDRKEEELQANTRQYNRVLENIIRQYPEQWLWVHRRWKNRPTQRGAGLCNEFDL